MSRNPLKLKRKDLGNLLKLHFPKFRGRNITLHISENYRVNSLDLYWSGGSKTEYEAFTGNSAMFNSRGTKYVNPLTTEHGMINIELGAKVMVLELIRMGQSSWMNVYVGLHSDWLPKMLEAIKGDK